MKYNQKIKVRWNGKTYTAYRYVTSSKESTAIMTGSREIMIDFPTGWINPYAPDCERGWWVGIKHVEVLVKYVN